MINYERTELPLYEKYERTELPYGLGDLEQIISLTTMRFHYDVLHQNYEKKLLETIRGREIEEKFPTLINLLENLEILPEEIKDDVRFFGGGLINHNFFFLQLTPFKPNRQEYELEEKISLALLNLIQSRFTNLKGLKRELVASAALVRGAGWTWLVLNKAGKLQIINTANQDGPWALHLRPLIAIDVWEHAYYFDYKTNREGYVRNLLDYLLNWDYISQLYLNYSNNLS